jgi:hypothetical protein
VATVISPTVEISTANTIERARIIMSKSLPLKASTRRLS